MTHTDTKAPGSSCPNSSATRPRNGRQHSPVPYNEELLVSLLSEGLKTQQQIADTVGISQSMVGKIARGESRRDLSDRVRQLRAHHVQALQHMAVAWAGRALQGHIREGLQRSGETARRCREFIIAMAQKYDPTLEAITDMQIDSAAGLSESLDDFLDHCQRKALPASSNG